MHALANCSLKLATFIDDKRTIFVGAGISIASYMLLSPVLMISSQQVSK